MNGEERKKKGFERPPIAEIIIQEKGKIVRIPRGRISKKEKREPAKLISIRLPESLLKKIDDYTENNEVKERSLAIRYLLGFALATIEKFEAGEILFKEELNRDNRNEK